MLRHNPEQGRANNHNYGRGLANGLSYGHDSFSDQVDALAHPLDYKFDDVRTNQTAMLYSLRNNALYGQGADIGAPVYYETTGGATGVWATAAQVNQHGVQNLDSLPTSTDSAYPGSHDLNFSNRPVRTRMPGSVGGIGQVS